VSLSLWSGFGHGVRRGLRPNAARTGVDRLSRLNSLLPGCGTSRSSFCRVVLVDGAFLSSFDENLSARNVSLRRHPRPTLTYHCEKRLVAMSGVSVSSILAKWCCQVSPALLPVHLVRWRPRLSGHRVPTDTWNMTCLRDINVGRASDVGRMGWTSTTILLRRLRSDFVVCVVEGRQFPPT
jgi:hypothetical protein